MKSPWRGFLTGWVIVIVGAYVAHLTQTTGGIIVKDVRFVGSSGNVLSALLYIPPNATAKTPAPGVLAVHGYINSREVQSGFAIEFARRGYVVLALDQTGHGYSDPPAFEDGFGGPAALSYLRSLKVVDGNNIGLEGHSMGGWAVLAAATVFPDDYTSMVLEGSSTGPPFAAEGTSSWPRNVSVVFSQFDEFAEFMWGVERAQNVASSTKLQTLFGTNSKIIVGEIYGNITAGTARILQQPPVTHPGDHISHDAIGRALDWFAKTLVGGTPLPSEDQIWSRKELGTLTALIGLVVLILGTFHALLHTQFFKHLAKYPSGAAYSERSPKWWLLAIATAVIPVATFYIFFGWGENLLPPSSLLPQSITNQVVFWALLNGVIAAVIGLAGFPKKKFPTQPVLHCFLLALASVGIAYLAVILVDFLFLVDFRFWFVGVKPLSLLQGQFALAYLLPFTLYFIFALRGLHGGLSVATDKPFTTYAANAFLLMGGFLLFLCAQYANLFLSGTLLTPGEPLNTIVMIQFVPLLLIVAIISTFAYRRTAHYLPGAILSGIFVTWYIVAGQATHAFS